MPETTDTPAEALHRKPLPILELLLGVAFLGLLIQLFPGILPVLNRLTNVANWPPGSGLVANIAVLLLLFGVRSERPRIKRACKIALLAAAALSVIAAGWQLALAVGARLPLYAERAWWLVDFRNWSRRSWFSFNVAVLVVLFTVRLAPDVVSAIKKEAMTWKARSTKRALKQERFVAGVKMTPEEERAMYKRVIEARQQQERRRR